MASKDHQAERLLETKRAALEDPEVVTDGLRLQEAYREMEEAQRVTDQLYARWEELEEKKGYPQCRSVGPTQ